MTTLPNCVKCKDNRKYPAPPCKFALLPDAYFDRNSEAMSKLGYIKCAKDNIHRRGNTDRQCQDYRRE